MTSSSSTTTTTSSASPPPTHRNEEVLVLYGSQTGNSEQAATELAAQMTSKLTPLLASYQTDAANKSTKTITVTPKLMQLDDFLEVEQAKWTRLVVIIVSSYGIGQAPLGARRFREFIDDLIETYTDNDTITRQSSDPPSIDASENGNNDDDVTTTTTTTALSTTPKPPLLLNGITFAMCGLGDSKFPTFFQNPTALCRGLKLAGAVQVGPWGKADASSGRDLEIIAEWQDAIWPHLAQVIAQEPTVTTPEALLQMQKDTLEICYRLNPDMRQRLLERQQQEQRKLAAVPMWTVVSAAVVMGVAIAAFYIKN